jgi:hypothetical protein
MATGEVGVDVPIPSALQYVVDKHDPLDFGRLSHFDSVHDRPKLSEHHGLRETIGGHCFRFPDFAGILAPEGSRRIESPRDLSR